jgi:hypothetical protein
MLRAMAGMSIGLSRRAPKDLPDVRMSRPTCWTRLLCMPRWAVCADPRLHHHLDAPGVRSGKHPRQRALVRNLLDALSPKNRVRHVALVTGLKHYLGPFEAYASSGTLPDTPLRESQPRLPLDNFYYAQEDEVYAAAARDRFTWSVHRPHTIIGQAVGNAMNLGTTLAVYATICKETGRPFQFPGSEAQWNGLSDVTDARMLAKQLVWAADTDAAKNEAFNIVNGDVFRWSWLWPKLAAGSASRRPASAADAAAGSGDGARRAAVARDRDPPRPGRADLDRLASPWHTDLDLGRPLEVMTDMANSRRWALPLTSLAVDEESLFFDLFRRRYNAVLVLRPVRPQRLRCAEHAPALFHGPARPYIAPLRCPSISLPRV